MRGSSARSKPPSVTKGHLRFPLLTPSLKGGGQGRDAVPPPGGIRLSALPAPRRATHRRGLGLLRRGRPFQQIPRERHPQGIILPRGLCRFCSVAIPLGTPACAGPAARWRGDFPQEGTPTVSLSKPFPSGI